MNKIAIVGCPASGKTTLANKLGSMFNIPVHHLDKIFWVTEGGIKQDVFIQQQEELVRGDAWIIDGGFMKSKSYDLRLENADTIIFFKFPKQIIYWRLFKRFLKYFNKPRPDMAGNRKDHINWSIIRFIWSYPSEEEFKRVSGYSNTKNVIILCNRKNELAFWESFK